MGMVLEALPLSWMTGVVEFEAVEFALGSRFWIFGSLIVDDEEVTDLEVAAEADWLRRVESWSPDTHTLVPSDLLAQS